MGFRRMAARINSREFIVYCRPGNGGKSRPSSEETILQVPQKGDERARELNRPALKNRVAVSSWYLSATIANMEVTGASLPPARPSIGVLSLIAAQFAKALPTHEFQFDLFQGLAPGLGQHPVDEGKGGCQQQGVEPEGPGWAQGLQQPGAEEQRSVMWAPVGHRLEKPAYLGT